MVHSPINVLVDFVPIHTLANLKTNAPGNTSELSTNRELRRGHTNDPKCDFEYADEIPDCCKPIGRCSHLIKPPTSYKRRSKKDDRNAYEIYWEYFKGTAVFSCNIKIKPNDHCCLWEHRCYRHPYTEFIYFKFITGNFEIAENWDNKPPPENPDYYSSSTTLKPERTDTVPNEYDWSTTLKLKETEKTTPSTSCNTKTKKKKNKSNKHKHKHEHHHHYHTPLSPKEWWDILASYFYKGKK